MIGELEHKRDHPELGWFARQALRRLDDLRVAHGRLDPLFAHVTLTRSERFAIVARVASILEDLPA